LSSVNGTFLNGNIRLIPKTPHLLRDGDVLKLGETHLRFTVR